MASYDPDRQRRWAQIIGGLRTLAAVGTLSMFLALAVPVLLKQLPPANPSLERRLPRMRKISLLHLALFGGVDVVLLILILARVLRQT